jgi:predicted nucleotidyltransferase
MKERIKREIIEIINRYLPGEKLVILFGSFAREKTDRLSDVDIAIFTGKRVRSNLFVELQETLSEEVHTLREIDLVDLADVRDDLIQRILDEGVIWISSEGLLKDLKKLSRNTRRL